MVPCGHTAMCMRCAQDAVVRRRRCRLKHIRLTPRVLKALVFQLLESIIAFKPVGFKLTLNLHPLHRGALPGLRGVRRRRGRSVPGSDRYPLTHDTEETNNNIFVNFSKE